LEKNSVLIFLQYSRIRVVPNVTGSTILHTWGNNYTWHWLDESLFGPTANAKMSRFEVAFLFSNFSVIGFWCSLTSPTKRSIAPRSLASNYDPTGDYNMAISVTPQSRFSVPHVELNNPPSTEILAFYQEQMCSSRQKSIKSQVDDITLRSSFLLIIPQFVCKNMAQVYRITGSSVRCYLSILRMPAFR
jgi:hypothetical protein